MTDQRVVCEQVADGLASRVGHERFDRYFASTARLGWERDELLVRVPSSFYADWLGRRFGDPLHAAACDALGRREVRVRWVVDGAAREQADTPDPRPDAPAQHRPARAERPARRRRGGGARLELDDFVVGACNRVAFEAGVRLVEEADPGYRLLFVHGACGVGKTHLLQGLARRAERGVGGGGVWYVTGESFTNAYIQTVREGRVERFRARVRALEVLCIDDVHFLAGKEGTQSEVLHTLDALDLRGGRVVLASDAHPRGLSAITERFASRCLSGMLVEMHEPDRDTRRGLIALLARRHGLALGAGVEEAICDLAGPSARDLSGAVNTLATLSRVEGRGGEVDAAMVSRGLASRGRSSGPSRPIRAERVFEVVCRELGVDAGEVLGRGRHKRLVLARSLTAYLSRELTTQSFPEIARVLGRGNHSTVVTACARLRRQIEAGERFGSGDGLSDVTVASIAQRIAAELRRAG